MANIDAMLKKIIAEEDLTVAELLVLANQCHGQGDSWKAIAYCEEIILSDKNNAEARLLLGQCLFSTGNLRAAGNSLSHAIELNPEHAIAYLQLGEVNAQLGQTQEALRCFQCAIQFDPNNAELFNAYAVFLWGIGKLNEARDLFKRALILEPESVFIKRNQRILSSRHVDRWHFSMVNDLVRNQQFELALKRVVTEDSVVLDIGAGTGLLSLMAARAGAKHVIACEANASLAELAREIIKINGYSDRIRVINKSSQQLVPEQDFPKNIRPNVLVAEIFDAQVIGEGALATLEHARRYLISDDAVMLPNKAVLCAGLVESTGLWDEGGVDHSAGFDLTPLNRHRPDTIALEVSNFSGRFLADEFSLFAFDFSNAYTSAETQRLDIPILETGICHALVYWINLTLDGTNISNRPFFEGEESRSDNCAHWYQAAKILVPALPVVKGMVLRIDVSHNRQAVAVVVYDPITGQPLD